MFYIHSESCLGAKLRQRAADAATLIRLQLLHTAGIAAAACIAGRTWRRAVCCHAAAAVAVAGHLSIGRRCVGLPATSTPAAAATAAPATPATATATARLGHPWLRRCLQTKQNACEEALQMPAQCSAMLGWGDKVAKGVGLRSTWRVGRGCCSAPTTACVSTASSLAEQRGDDASGVGKQLDRTS